MREYTVEADWMTEAGLRAVVLMTELGHRCGYVGVPERHPLHGVDYDSTPTIDVHGGLTYSGGTDDYPTDSEGLWWFGYDCAHSGDKAAPGSRGELDGLSYGVHRSLDFCRGECESLAAQLVPSKRNPSEDDLKKLVEAARGTVRWARERGLLPRTASALEDALGPWGTGDQA